MNSPFIPQPSFDILLQRFPEAQQVMVGTWASTSPQTPALVVKNVTTGLVIVMVDAQASVATIAHTLLPDSNSSAGTSPMPNAESMPALFVNHAIPTLWKHMLAKQATPENTRVYLAGGSQLFTFGGGGGNPLNVGARNAILARSELSKLGLPIEYADLGGNRPRHVLFSLADDATYISIRGGDTKRV